MNLRNIIGVYLIIGAATLGVAIVRMFTHADEQASADILSSLGGKTTRQRWEDRFIAAVALLFIFAGWPAILYMFYEERQLQAKETGREKSCGFCIRQSDLIRHLSVGQIESLERIDDPMHAAPALPFGHLNEGWRKFIAQLTTGDTVWSFSTKWTDEFQRQICDEGYVILREGRIGAHYLTRSGYEFTSDDLQPRTEESN